MGISRGCVPHNSETTCCIKADSAAVGPARPGRRELGRHAARRQVGGEERSSSSFLLHSPERNLSRPRNEAACSPSLSH